METKTTEGEQAGKMQTGNRTMTGCFREISHVFFAEENIKKAETNCAAWGCVRSVW